MINKIKPSRSDVHSLNPQSSILNPVQNLKEIERLFTRSIQHGTKIMMMKDTPEHIIQAIRHGGVVGAGGAGFPTHVKWQASVDTIIANGSECEPILTSDRTMMCQKPELLIEGLRLAMKATGASKGIIGLKSHYTDAIQAIRTVLPKDQSIQLYLLDNYYPAGDEFLLVYEVTGKVIPEGGLPLHVGVVVNNVVTLMQAAEALQGKPVVERPVTLAGEFHRPKVVMVPIGTTYQDLVAAAGGVKKQSVVLVDGGPMMGKIVENWEQGIGKTTSGILAFPDDHFIIRQMKKTLGQVIKQSKSACCQCFRCTDLCPRHLIGHEIYPHMTMRTIDYQQTEPAHHIMSAFLCSQCGTCELLACDFMMLSPRKIYAAYRQALTERGVKNPHQRKPKDVRSFFQDRKLSIETVLRKLDLSKYNGPIPFEGRVAVTRVRVPLNRHVGAPAVLTVKLGQKVRMCDEIARSPEGSLGTIYHAPIEGCVTDAREQWVEIRKV